MSIAGNLKTMPLSELLQWLSQSVKTGTLRIDNGHVRKEMHFQKGKITSSASTDPKEFLGHFLVSRGHINEEELAEAVRMQENSGMLLGKILITVGALDESELFTILRLKAEESIYDVFTWKAGEFRFYDGKLPTKTLIPISLDVTGVVMEGARRVDEWKRIREKVPGAEAIPVAMVEDLDDPKLSSSVRQILQMVDDNRTIEEIGLQTHSTEYHVCKVLFDQVEAKRLKVVKPRWRREPEPPAKTGAEEVSATSLAKEAHRHLQAGDLQRALRHIQAARSLEPDTGKVLSAVESLEKQLRTVLEGDGIALEAIPSLTSNLEELTSSRISPQEGFMISRINGTYDIRSILKISPMPNLEALLVFWRLRQQGHVELTTPETAEERQEQT